MYNRYRWYVDGKRDTVDGEHELKIKKYQLISNLNNSFSEAFLDATNTTHMYVHGYMYNKAEIKHAYLFVDLTL